MFRPRPALIVVAAVIVAFGIGALVTGRVSLAATPGATSLEQHPAVLDQQNLSLEVAPAAGQPAVDESRAATLAATFLPSSANPSRVQPRYGEVTFRDSDGKIIRGVQSRPAWLVTFVGVTYLPSGASASVCACASVYQRANTVVTLDARTGALIAILGVDS